MQIIAQRIIKCICYLSAVGGGGRVGKSDGFPGGPVVKNPSANAGDGRDSGSIPASGGFPGEGNGNPLQLSCLENLRAEEPGGLQSTGLQRI